MLEAKRNNQIIDKNNPKELYEYYLNNGIMLIEIINNEDGTYTHIYESGLIVNVKITLSGIKFPSNNNKLVLKR